MKPTIAVVIPSYKVKNHILKVILEIGPEVDRIFVVDDKCPVGSGDYVAENCNDPRVLIIRHEINQGVGGAVISGYKAAIKENIDIIVKVDGDGQMNPKLIPKFVQPIIDGDADYVKGNRFYDLTNIKRMPTARLIGNALLSFLTKFSSGYWHIFDPTNGYTAIHVKVASFLPLDKISRRYFFETDILFRLNTVRAVVKDIPMDAVYQDEESNLRISKIMLEFIFKHIRNTFKRVFYNYFLRDLNIASLELLLGSFLLLFGLVFGALTWMNSIYLKTSAPTGTIMLSVLPLIIGIQFIIAFLGYDISNVPRHVINKHLS
jgi:dolichol-phosphate mannosyltransferase